MKKLLIFILLTLSIFLFSCREGETIYTIQFTDDSGIQHTIEVKYGENYKLDKIPEKHGYIFMGLYDSKEGGTQYVDENGSAISEFKDSKNLTLFPQFKPKEYTLILDYQGADVTGSPSMQVAYNSIISVLPMNLTLENKDFKGWFTKPNREGIQVADEHGVIPERNQVTEKNFDLSDDKDHIYLYAGFKGKEYTVTFYASSSSQAEEIKVEHGTPISEVVPTTRINGLAVLTWSKHKNGGEIFNGNVTEDMTLYAVEYAPVIEFDSNGGTEVIPIVARAGDAIELPTPTKKLSKFSYWEDMSGNRFPFTIMPSKSISLKAVWQAKLEFDENGGLEIDDISEEAGMSIILPTPIKDGYVFAGWYTTEKEKYTSTIMPSNGVALKAGWYKEIKESIVIVAQNDVYESYGSANEELIDDALVVNMFDFLDESFSGFVSVKAHMKIKFTGPTYTNTPYISLRYYSQKTASSTYLLHTETIATTTSSYKDNSFAMNFEMSGNIMYCSRRFTYDPSYYTISDFYLEISYPDTTSLYL